MKNIGMLDSDKEYVWVPHKHGIDAVIAWLDEYAGQGHFALGGYGVYFEDEQDATVFALRWA